MPTGSIKRVLVRTPDGMAFLKPTGEVRHQHCQLPVQIHYHLPKSRQCHPPIEITASASLAYKFTASATLSYERIALIIR